MRISDWSSDVCSSDLAAIRTTEGWPARTVLRAGQRPVLDRLRLSDGRRRMKHDEVPQDELPYYGEQRQAVYALDGTGQYSAVPSSGWTVDATVTGEAIHEFERMAADPRHRAETGPIGTTHV